MKFQTGDKVYYVGSNRAIQQDYGKRELIIMAIDSKTRRVACTASDGRLLVGVNSEDIQYAREYALQGASEAS